MKERDPFESLFGGLSSLIPDSAQQFRKDMEQNMRAGLESGLRNMNLVTREELDVQNKVLLRTREKLEALEKQVAELEQQLLKQPVVKSEQEKKDETKES